MCLQAMVFALENADAAGDVVEVLEEALTLSETPPATKLARLYLVNDILANATAPVRNASRCVWGEGVRGGVRCVAGWLVRPGGIELCSASARSGQQPRQRDSTRAQREQVRMAGFVVLCGAGWLGGCGSGSGSGSRIPAGCMRV
jgi:hypothetical protein